MGPAQQSDKPYKPKFHKAVLYNSDQQEQHVQQQHHVLVQEQPNQSNQVTVLGIPERTAVGAWEMVHVPQHTVLPIQPTQPKEAPLTQVVQVLPSTSTSVGQDHHPMQSSPNVSSHIPPRLSHLVRENGSPGVGVTH